MPPLPSTEWPHFQPPWQADGGQVARRPRIMEGEEVRYFQANTVKSGSSLPSFSSPLAAAVEITCGSDSAAGRKPPGPPSQYVEESCPGEHPAHCGIFFHPEKNVEPLRCQGLFAPLEWPFLTTVNIHAYKRLGRWQAQCRQWLHFSGGLTSDSFIHFSKGSRSPRAPHWRSMANVVLSLS